MFWPHVASGMFVVCSFCLWSYELKGLLGIGCDAHSGADLPKSWRGLIDLDFDMGIFEQGDSSAEATNASADDCDTERLG